MPLFGCRLVLSKLMSLMRNSGEHRKEGVQLELEDEEDDEE
jgi:hypothetical protein